MKEPNVSLCGARTSLRAAPRVTPRGLRDRRAAGASRARGWRGALVVAGALGCNAMLDIESAALERAANAPDAGAADTLGVPASNGLGQDEALSGIGASAAPAPPDGTPASMASRAGDANAPPASIPTEPGTVPPAAAEPALPSAPADAGASAPPASPVPTQPVPTEPPLDANGLAVPLPNDLIDAPVSGEIIFSEEASWEVDGVFRPTFEVHTPSASYWVVKSLGTMVSMQDAYAGRLQWIDFSSGFRPLRNIPAFAAPPANVSTVLDRDSQTPTHLRLSSESPDGAWRWVWDFYVTHATFTVDRAPVPIGFSYRGVPAGTLGTEDQLVQSDGTAQGARNSFNGDVPGPIEWVYFADTAARRSLFLMQHRDDDLAEAYQVRDNDSAAFSFGGGAISALPLRFSLGLIDSTDHATVSRRVAYVAGAIH